jgi:hypothetical protein
VDEIRISPQGDPFTSAPRHPDQEHPHACIDGWVYLGELVEDPETGGELEVYTVVRCRRCQPRRSHRRSDR